ncbi:hypothetical protein AU184_08785 [Mycolicibacterium novocastrense]|uniref:MarR family winged helix-turn-helix transcriptional regulator n=1 Tax=Mycolicibacterium novocastrense TaxID=59813 RepID=UPI000749432F|nr:MarR family winged helix-turn-helix transcriptional regulator [Mycolicibacterium novocastrense]KUH69811.1 hypothetical protein AU184_08785 [Mycolicibacterium novocastrense]KUH71360.1 hypothetical protein AU183_06155 [Mycolicibacterium novocastrense]KUH74424.1 hypothetical protein AU072_17570 [Mycolicibacterium novocastrense]
MPKDIITGSIDQWSREDPGLPLDGLRFTMWLTRAARLLERSFSTVCKNEFKLLPSEARLLLALRRSGRPFALRPTDLFRAQLVSSGGMTKQIDRLCKSGLVVRNRDPLHAGGYLVQLTSSGLKTADRLTGYLLKEGGVSDTIEKELHRLGPAKAKVISAFLDSALDVLEDAAGENSTADAQD